MKKLTKVEDVKIGTKLLIQTKPEQWASCKKHIGNSLELIYPLTIVVQDIHFDMYSSIGWNGYGFYLDGLIEKKQCFIISYEAHIDIWD